MAHYKLRLFTYLLGICNILLHVFLVMTKRIQNIAVSTHTSDLIITAI